MFKIMILGKKRPDISRAAFIAAYESDHIALASRLVSENKLPPMLDYRRNYIVHDDVLNTSSIEFDVVTEAVFPDRETFEINRSNAAEPEVARLLIDDLQEFLDLSSLQYVVVEERIGGGGAPGG